MLARGGIALVVSSAADDVLAGRASTGSDAEGRIDGRPLQPRFLRNCFPTWRPRWWVGQGTADDPTTVLGVGFKAPISAAVAEGIRRFLDRFPADMARRRRYPAWYLHLAGRYVPRQPRNIATVRLYATQFMFDLGGRCPWETLATVENAGVEE